MRFTHALQSIRRLHLRPAVGALLLLAVAAAGPADARESVVIGANVNMVSGADFPAGDPFQRQQNEPSVAFSSRNSLHLLAGANDYRAVDVPGLPGGRETGDSWLSYFWSTNGGATWRSTLIPGYPQDPACDGSASQPALCGYAAGADPVVRAGVNGMFYYSGIVFERTDPSRSAIFVSRFIDLNNDEGGDPIRYLDTVLLDTNDDGREFLDKSWIGVDIPRNGAASKTLSVPQRNGTTVAQTVACGNLYVGYAAIGGEGQNLRSEIRLAISTDCGDTWSIQLISQPDSLNQGANIGIDPMSGDVHVVWRRFDTVETFLGIPAAGCPADPSSWEVNEDWPVATVTVAGITYTAEEARDLLATKHKGDETYRLVNEIIAAKLNLLTGGGDAVEGFNANQWGQQLSNFIAQAEAWLMDNPVGSDPKYPEKQVALDLKKDLQEILLGSGVCGGGPGTPGGTTGETNAILVASSTDGGQSFSAPIEVDESSTFDQGSTTFSFRTTAYPTVAVDASGRLYVAWAARGFAPDQDASLGDARIVVSTSADGVTWTAPAAVDEPNRPGHQIKPSLLFAGGQLTLVYYDFRGDVSNIFESFVVDLPEPDRLRHTVDVRVAVAAPAANPTFTDYSLISGTDEPEKPSTQASRYKFLTAVTEYPFPAPYDQPNSTVQAEYMVPNYPMFADGTTPFIGDYVDIAAPNLIFEEGSGWRFATGASDVSVWQAVWSDNRDVVPPPDGDWSKYVAPITQAQPSLFDPTVTLPSCNDVVFADAPPQWQSGSLYTGTRNQNVYSAAITHGLIVAAPGNNRPLVDSTGTPIERAFVVYAQNATALERTFAFTVTPPTGVSASFVAGQAVTTIEVTIPPYSSAAHTVYALATTSTPSSERIRVDVTEIGGSLSGSVLLNSDPGAPLPLPSAGVSLLDAEIHDPALLNPAILDPTILDGSADPSLCTSDPTLCVQNPAILNPAILNPAILNPAILNPAIFNPAIFNPAILNPAILNPAILNPAIFNPAIFNPAILNPAILNPAILNPAIMNPAILNPAILNPAILNPAILNPAILNPAILNPAILNTTTADSGQVDVTFAVRNDGNATTAYDLNLAAQQLEGLDYELLVYGLNETPVADGCVLTTEAQQYLVFRQDDPLSRAVDGTFYLEPGQEILVTFRVTPDTTAPFPGNPVADFDVADLSGQVTSQPTNTDGTPQPPADQFGSVTPAPVSLWLADGDALDSIGANDGTLQNGAGFAVGRVGQAFSLDSGLAQHVLIPDDPSLDITNQLTIAAWIYPTGPGTGPAPQGVGEGGIIVNKEYSYEVARFADGSIRWATGDGAGSFAPIAYWIDSGGVAPLNTWTHVAFTYDQGVGTTYINGTAVHSVDLGADNLGAGTFPLRIGGRGFQSQFFDGSLDEVALYDTALAPADVLALVQAAPPLPTPLLSISFEQAWGWDVVSSGPNDTVANQFEICTTADVCKNGVTGTGNGQYVSPTGVDLDLAGNFYTVGWGSERVQVSDAAGTFLRTFGNAAQFDNPSGVAVDDALDRVYVADRLDSEIEVYDRLGNLITSWGSFGFDGGQFVAPYDLALDADGNLYVADADGLNVQVLDNTGAFVRMFGWGVDTGAAAFEICTPATQPCQSASFGYGAGQFSYPTGIAVNSAGEIFVTDEAAPRVQVFDNSGNFLRAFGWGVDTGAAAFEICTAATAPCQRGSQGSAAGQLWFAQNVTVDGADRVWVADSNNARIQVFSGAGEFLATFGWGVDSGAAGFEVCTWATQPCQSGSFGGGGGQFSYPWGVGVSPLDGRVFVSDFGQARVQVFDVQVEAPAFSVSSFDPSVVFSGTSAAQEAALNAAVGVTGYVIEDFEDLALVPGLTVSGGVFGLNSQSAFPGAVWDGTSYYVDQALTATGVTFDIAGGTSSFGIGLADIDVAEVNLFVNGEDYGSIMDLPNWVKLGDNVRDVYIRVDAPSGESIESVQIRQVSGGFSDGIFFDHVAIAP